MRHKRNDYLLCLFILALYLQKDIHNTRIVKAQLLSKEKNHMLFNNSTEFFINILSLKLSIFTINVPINNNERLSKLFQFSQ